MKSGITLSLVSVAAAMLVTTAVQASETCEQMRDRIEAQAKAHKLLHPKVSIVTNDEARAATDKVVGSCGHGSKKIVLIRSGGN